MPQQPLHEDLRGHDAALAKITSLEISQDPTSSTMDNVRIPSVTLTPSLSRRASSVSLREEPAPALQFSRNRHGSTHSLRSHEDAESATPLLPVASTSDWHVGSRPSDARRRQSGEGLEYSEKASSERSSSSSNRDPYGRTGASPLQSRLDENVQDLQVPAGGCSCLPTHMLGAAGRQGKSQQALSMSLRIAASVVASLLLYLLIVVLRGDHQASLSGILPKATFIDGASSLYRSSPGFSGDAQHADIFPGLHNLCDICDCSSPDAPSLPASSFKLRKDVKRSDLPDLVRHAILDIQCRHVYSTRNKAFVTLRDMIREPSAVMAWDLSKIDLGKPTSYMFTKTAPVSKVASLRAQYLERHVKTMHLFDEKMAKSADAGGWAGHYEDGSDAASKQTLWILAEDNNVIDQNVAAMLAEGDVNYIYFALGPTRNFGNAQHNAALSMIYHLSNEHTGALGHGPIFSADDDAEIHPDLLLYVWRLKRIGLWPMGNLGPTGFEGPVWDGNDQISGWSAGNSWRKYPVDNGAFAFNSTLLGNELPGPAFWPTDTDGGETEFIERVVQSKAELEPICKDCHVAWHNHPLNIPHVGSNVYRPG